MTNVMSMHPRIIFVKLGQEQDGADGAIKCNERVGYNVVLDEDATDELDIGGAG